MKSRVMLVAVLMAGCSTGKSSREVPIHGLPCLDGALVTPIVIATEQDDGSGTLEYVGGNPTKDPSMKKPPTMTLEVNKEQTLKIRVGYCKAGDCRKPEWVGGVQLVKVDTHDPNAQLILGIPGEHPCR